jgi:hypothetical protein
MRACFHSDQNLRARTQKSLSNADTLGLGCLQSCELLAKSQVLEKEYTTSAEESNDRAYQESNGGYHARVLSHFACGRQLCILLKSQADRILANDTGEVMHSPTTCIGLISYLK